MDMPIVYRTDVYPEGEKNVISREDMFSILEDYRSRYSRWDVAVLRDGILLFDLRDVTPSSLIENVKVSVGDCHFEVIQLKLEKGELLLISSVEINLDWKSVQTVSAYRDRISIACHSLGKTADDVVLDIFGSE